MKNKKLLFAIIFLVVVLGLDTWVSYLSFQQQTAGEKFFKVTVVHSDGTSKDFSYDSKEEYVGIALQKKGLIEGTQGEYGLYIEKVDGEQAIYETDGAYWSFEVNGVYAEKGIDLTPLEDGGVYRLVYTKAE